MSELSRQIASNTQGIYNAGRDLVALKARTRARKDEAFARIGEALKDAQREYRENLSWRDARDAEREIGEIESAYALGYSTKGGAGARAALSGLRPKTAPGAVRLSVKLREAAGDERYDVEWKAKQAQAASEAAAKRRANLMDRALKFAELEANGKELEYKRTKDVADREASMSELKFKTTADAIKWWFSRKPEQRPDINDVPMPDNQRTMYEKRWNLPDGYLAGLTPNQINKMLSDEAARVNATKQPAQRQRDPRASPYQNSMLDAIENDIAALDKFINENAWNSAAKADVAKAREDRATLARDRDTMIGGLPGAPGGGGPAPTPAPAGGNVAIDPEMQREFDALPPAEQAAALQQMTPEERAKVGR